MSLGRPLCLTSFRSDSSSATAIDEPHDDTDPDATWSMMFSTTPGFFDLDFFSFSPFKYKLSSFILNFCYKSQKF